MQNKKYIYKNLIIAQHSSYLKQMLSMEQIIYMNLTREYNFKLYDYFDS